MQCASCGTFLQPGASTCPNCGAPVTAPPPVTTQPAEKTSYFYDEYIPFTDQKTPLSKPSELATQITEPEEILPPSPAANPTPPRRAPLLALTTAFSILSLLIIIVLVFLLIHNATDNHAMQTHTNQFATSDPQAIYTQVTTKIPAVNDAFSSKTSKTWTSATTGSCAVSGNTLHETAPQGTSVLCTSTDLSVSNFACQVQITLTRGDIFGLVFRANQSTLKSYVIDLTSQATYLLGTGQSGTTTFKILAEGNSSTINEGSGQSNLLTIIALGNIIYVYINKLFIVSTSDPSSSSGLIGVASGGTITNIPVDATFSHLQVWNL